jgi:putative tricarboxylic transport membrane protein
MKVGWLVGLTVVGAALLASFSSGQAGRKIRIMAPCTPGCSWEVMAQNMARVMKEEGIADSVEVYTITGNGIPAALQKFSTEQRGNPNELMAIGLGVIGANLVANASLQITAFTPVARMAAEYEVLFVASNSPYKSLNDLVKAWKANPDAIVWGGTSRGSTAHMLAGQLARVVGIDPAKVKFNPSNGNLQGARAMVAGDVTVVSVSYTAVEELIKANQIRPLAISSPKRVAGLEIPTYAEQGINLQFLNWRGVVAPPGITASQRLQWQVLIGKLNRNTAWRENATANNWLSYYQTGESFRTFLNEQQASVTDLLRSLTLIK